MAKHPNSKAANSSYVYVLTPPEFDNVIWVEYRDRIGDTRCF